MLDQVTAALAALKAEGAFATELACGSDDLHLEVAGVGPVRFPISAATAKKLCAVGRPAPFGRRDATVHDPSVRDTLEILRRGLKIDARPWKRALEPQLALVRQQLGLPEEGKLEAILDKLLVYGPGQFFAPHQDSERDDAMVGSLVVELPSRHEGGSVVVQHHQEKQVFSGAARGAKDLSLLAFYADCHHEVKPVESGYRITLTYHLLYHGEAGARARVPPDAVDRLAKSVSAHFSTPLAIGYSSAPPQRPDRLIYLVDHEYTQKSLHWDHLKNADRLRAGALRQVAERLDCEVFLALADVHESWMCEDEYWGGRSRRGRYRYGYDEDRDAEDPELVELLDTEVELRHWVDAEGRVAEGVATRPWDSEICFTRASTEMAPFRSEHEGYTGNAGNTVDRWYHRAALVMWPRDRSFALRAQVSPSWAVKEIAARLAAGAADEARRRADELLPFWPEAAPKESDAAFFPRLLGVLAKLGSADLALQLLAPFGPHRLNAHALPGFVALVERHGLAWSRDVFSAWAGKVRYDTPPWLPSLPRLCEALHAGGEQGQAVAAWLLAREVTAFEQRHVRTLQSPEALVEESVQTHLDDLLALLEAVAAIHAPAIRDDLLAFLVAPYTALPPLSAGALLRKVREAHPPAALRALGLHPLYGHLEASLERALAAPPRAADDWSITPPPGCTCALCTELAAFLRDPGATQLAWPLAKERRRHVHGVLDRHRLPVTHVTQRHGSPHTLVLTKQRALFEREEQQSAKYRALLGWLETQRAAFSEARPPARAPRR